jgi:putative sterol carrier protein
VDLSDFASVDPQHFAALVRSAPKSQLTEIMEGPDRSRVLDEIFRRFPSQFRADRAGNTDTVIHWTIGGRPDGGSDTYEVVIADGACTVSPIPMAEPKLAITVGGADFLHLIAGVANPMVMFMTGKVKAKGDLTLAANLATLFDLPKG